MFHGGLIAGMTLSIGSLPELSSTVGNSHVTFRESLLGAASTVASSGQVMIGGVISEMKVINTLHAKRQINMSLYLLFVCLFVF